VPASLILSCALHGRFKTAVFGGNQFFILLALEVLSAVKSVSKNDHETQILYSYHYLHHRTPHKKWPQAASFNLINTLSSQAETRSFTLSGRKLAR
jgi:hypothetical protein